jgi:hypothetical protein
VWCGMNELELHFFGFSGVNMTEVSIHSLQRVVSFKWSTPLKLSK